jgi:hypothetical protein
MKKSITLLVLTFLFALQNTAFAIVCEKTANVSNSVVSTQKEAKTWGKGALIRSVFSKIMSEKRDTTKLQQQTDTQSHGDKYASLGLKSVVIGFLVMFLSLLLSLWIAPLSLLFKIISLLGRIGFTIGLILSILALVRDDTSAKGRNKAKAVLSITAVLFLVGIVIVVILLANAEQ